MTNSMIHMGVIGIGNMGTEHIRNILKGLTPQVCLTAVADKREERREWAMANCPDTVRVFDEGENLIKSGLCDAVLIATPHYTHPTLSLVALENGLHVLCEKPIGVYTQSVRPVIQVAKEKQKTFALMFNQRTNCVYRKMKDVLSSNELGAIKRVNWTITDWYRTQFYYDSGSWRATWDGEGGGVLINQCPHQLDLLQWLCGMPVSVRAFCREGLWHHIEVEDDVTAYLTFENGASGVFVTSTGDLPGVNRLEITCDRGRLVCENDRLLLYKLPVSEREYCFSARESFSDLQIQEIALETDGINQQHIGVINAFTAHILYNEDLVASAEEGLNSLMLSNAMHLSAWLDQTISLPIDEALFSRLLHERRQASQPKTCRDITCETDHSRGGQTIKHI